MQTWLIVAAYFVGTIPFALVLSRRFGGTDLRYVGSGNVGAANALRTAGRSAGLLALVLDIGKGGVAVWLADRVGADASTRAAVATAVVTGHVFPIWLRFRGGKGVATACGAFSVLTPPAAIVAALAFAVVVWATRLVSLGSMCATVVLMVVVWVTGAPDPVLLSALGVGAIILARHRTNIVRLRAGQEHRLGA